MINLLDYILDLFRDEGQAQAFVANPDQAPRGRRLVDCQFCAAAVGGRDGQPESGDGRQR